MSPTAKRLSWALIALSVALVTFLVLPRASRTAADDAARVALDLSNPNPEVRLYASRLLGCISPFPNLSVESLSRNSLPK